MTTTSFVDDLVARLDADFSDLGALPLTPLDDEQVATLVQVCTTLADRLTHSSSRVLVEANNRSLGDKIGARHTSAWWAAISRMTSKEAGKRLSLARQLDRPLYQPVADALADGRIHTEHAQVIIDAVNDLPDELEPALVEKARDTLLNDALTFDPLELSRLGKAILETLDPQRFEDEEAKRLQREEDEANAKARITFSNDGHGRVHGRFSLPALHGELLRNQVLALADPRRDLPGDDSSSGDGQSRQDGPLITPERMGHALMELIEMFPADRLPTHAASSVALIITLDISELLKANGFATLANGEKITAGEARRLACRSDFLPAVLDGASEVLDLGRVRRVYSVSQFRALTLRDGGCTAVGCGMPASVCHAHHDDPWSQGGGTDLANGRLLCPHHHRLIHHPGHNHSIDSDNKVRFRKRH